MRIILLIGIGSFLGGIGRFLLTSFVQNKWMSTFPYGTFLVNVLGCFLIGVVYALSDRGSIHTEWRLFLATGIMGGFTTFSSFSNETVSMITDGQFTYAFSYVAGSILIGVAATFAGIYLVKLF